MNKIKTLLAAVFLITNCTVATLNTSGTSLGDNKKRAAMCKKLCEKRHYNVKLIRPSGEIEELKIHIISIDEKTACLCKF